MSRAKLLFPALLAACMSVAAVPAARAATEAAFTQQAFAASQREGKPILVEITASWCPVCAKQRPVLGRIVTDPAFKDLVVYTVDFDTQKDVVRELGARMQSTLIAFHGAAEKARSTGETDSGAIRNLVAEANQ